MLPQARNFFSRRFELPVKNAIFALFISLDLPFFPHFCILLFYVIEYNMMGSYVFLIIFSQFTHFSPKNLKKERNMKKKIFFPKYLNFKFSFAIQSIFPQARNFFSRRFELPMKNAIFALFISLDLECLSLRPKSLRKITQSFNYFVCKQKTFQDFRI